MKRLNLEWLQGKQNPEAKQNPFTHEQIRAKAHEIWLSRNGSAGSSEQDWNQAINALEVEKSFIKRFRELIKQFRIKTGFKDKSLWDFYVLLLPIAVAIGTAIYQIDVKKFDLFIADDRAKQETLAKYFDQMSELLISKGLRKSKSNSEVFILAQARTATALRSLDTERQKLLIEFLKASDLFSPKKRTGLLQKIYLANVPLIGTQLSGANLSGADLSETNLSNAFLLLANLSNASLVGANLSGVDLTGANLSNTSLVTANLSGANLRGANLSRADLIGSDLGGAYLIRANLFSVDLETARNLTQDQLNEAKLCNTKLPSGVISNRDCKSLDENEG